MTSVLAPFAAPLGSPDAVATIRRGMAAAAAVLADSLQTVTRSSADLVGSGWAGIAADAWAAAAAAPAHGLAQCGQASQVVAGALEAWEAVLRVAQADWRRAEAAAERDLVRQRAAEAAEGMPPGTISGTGLEVLLLAPLSSYDPGNPDRLEAESLGRRAVELTAQGQRLVTEVLLGVAEAVEQATASLVESTRPPNWSQRHLGMVGNALTGFVDAGVESLEQGLPLVGLYGDAGAAWRALGSSLPAAAAHPVEAGKAMIGWDELAAGRYDYWAGGLTFMVAGAAVSGGVAGVLKATRAGRELTALADTLGVGRAGVRSGARGPTVVDGGSAWAVGAPRPGAWVEGLRARSTGASPGSAPGGAREPVRTGPSQPRAAVDGLGRPIPDTGQPVPAGYRRDVTITEERALHILDGDPVVPGKKPGGGHRSGVGNADKSEFPPGWSESTIIQHVMDIARNPPEGRTFLQNQGKYAVWDVRDGVQIEVIVNKRGEVVTAYPQSGPGVIRNPPSTAGGHS